VLEVKGVVRRMETGLKQRLKLFNKWPAEKLQILD
jgi:hypothetical protein